MSAKFTHKCYTIWENMWKRWWKFFLAIRGGFPLYGWERGYKEKPYHKAWEKPLCVYVIYNFIYLYKWKNIHVFCLVCLWFVCLFRNLSFILYCCLSPSWVYCIYVYIGNFWWKILRVCYWEILCYLPNKLDFFW